MNRPARVLIVMTAALIHDGPTLSVVKHIEHMDRDAVQADLAAKRAQDEALNQRIRAAGCRILLPGDRTKHPIRYILALTKLIRTGRYDIVHAHGNSCTLVQELLAARLAGVKVRVAHSRNSQCRYALAHRLLRPLFNALYTDAWACGPEAGEWLFGKGHPFRIARNATETARCGYDLSLRSRYRQEFGLDDRFVIGSVANMTEQKNHAFLLDCFREYLKQDPDARLLLVGGGRGLERVRGEVEARGLQQQVIMTGTRSDAPELVNAFDAAVLPSLYEGFPNVLIEWQCSGVPCLVSDTVTRSAKLTNLVTYLPIDRGTQPWTDAWSRIRETRRDRPADSLQGTETIRREGYDIVTSASLLQEFYLEAAERAAKRT